uniref:Type VI secretion protein n=1 Tax=Raoultella ornithinolytica TaxID=54291 RepID=A0A0M5KLA1_RAOOR|nr:type VI secretion protein [Raoultella ornithinolytica]
MVVTLKVILPALPAIFSFQAVANPHYRPEQYLKNYALSTCAAVGYQSKEVKNDAAAAPRGSKKGCAGVFA